MPLAWVALERQLDRQECVADDDGSAVRARQRRMRRAVGVKHDPQRDRFLLLAGPPFKASFIERPGLSVDREPLRHDAEPIQRID